MMQPKATCEVTPLDRASDATSSSDATKYSAPGGGAHEYESDGPYVPTEERKQGALGVGFRRKKGGHWVWDQIGKIFEAREKF